MTPTPGDVHVNTPLTNISIAYMQKAGNFVADRVFPNIPVQKQSDRYYTYDRGDFNRDEFKERAPGTESEGSGFNVDNTPTYFCPVYAFHRDIPDQLRSNADSVINPDKEASLFVANKALIKREKTFVANYFATGLWTTELAGAGSADSTHVVYWNNTASTPIEDVRSAKRTMLQLTGFEPNKLVLGRKTYDKLMDHPEIIDRIKYGQTAGGPAQAGTDTLAKLFEVDDILVMNAIENTAAEGQTATHAFIGGNHALLVYAAPEPGLMTPTAGYTFSWTGHLGAGAMGGRVKSFRLEQIGSDRVEMEMAYTQKLVSADLGYFFNGVVQ